VSNKYDLLVVGAGLSGSVIAERAARILNWKVLVVERRNHIAGNCFDKTMNNGVLTHQYGPHYFRTNKRELVDYLSQFTTWIDGNYIVKSSFKNQLHPFPINLDTLEMFFGLKLDSQKANDLLERIRIHIDNPQNSEEFVLSRVGLELYEAFYKNYSFKQWGKFPNELANSVCGRIPVRFNRNHRYVDHDFQIMPKYGYTEMVKNMIQHPNITVQTNTDAKHLDLNSFKTVVYTGAVDEYFNYSLGHLPWRSLNFKFEELDCEFAQPCVQINYPNDFDYTRSVEIKHVTKQKHDKTVVVYEFPTAIGDPYYPIPTEESQLLYRKYFELAQNMTKEKNVHFVGRLAKYSYLNMDEVIEQALAVFETISKNNN